MIELQKVKEIDKQYLESLGFYWHTDSDNSRYISDEIIVISEQEALSFENAANELYDMFIHAGQYIIDNNLFHNIGIPFNLINTIKLSWENDVHWHLYGRFDFAGGIDGLPIKLLEFNADTPTSLFETAIIQWAILKYNGLQENLQFNGVYEAILDNFKRIVTLDNDIDRFDHLYEGWKFLFTSIRGNIEEENTVRLLQHIASKAGFKTKFAFADEIDFSKEDGIVFENENYELWFKLIPWEMIAIEEPDLAMLLEQIIQNEKAIIFNPAYTLLFQSKGIMKILWDLYPNHPLLLKTSFEPIVNHKYVKKPIFGREGGNVSIIDNDGSVLKSNDGEYENYKMIYQEYAQLAKDTRGNSYQAGVFYAYETCGLGFRKGREIIDNYSKFVGHIVK